MPCYDCGLEYGGDSWIEAIIPDKVWNKISPTGNQGGILCISCIAKRLRKLNINIGKIPIWLCGTEPLKAMPGDPSDEINILRNWDFKRIECQYIPDYIGINRYLSGDKNDKM